MASALLWPYSAESFSKLQIGKVCGLSRFVFHPRSRKGKQHNQRKTSLPGRSRCGSRAGRFYFIRENVKNQSGEALLDLGQVGQLVIDLGVVKHAAELLRTHAVGVDVHHGTGVSVGGMIHAGLVVDGVADCHAEGDVGAVQIGRASCRERV